MKEAALQQQCVGLLTVLERQGRLAFTAIPNGSVLAGDAEQRARQMNKLKNTGLRPGVPDLLIILPGGRCAWAELKSATGTLSAAQKEWRDRLEAMGHDWRLVRSVEELQTYLKEIGGDNASNKHMDG